MLYKFLIYFDFWFLFFLVPFVYHGEAWMPASFCCRFDVVARTRNECTQIQLQTKDENSVELCNNRSMEFRAYIQNGISTSLVFLFSFTIVQLIWFRFSQFNVNNTRKGIYALDAGMPPVFDFFSVFS